MLPHATAQALYSGTRSMPWQRSTASNGFDSSFGAGLENDYLVRSRIVGGAPSKAKRFPPASSRKDRRDIGGRERINLADTADFSQRCYSVFSSTTDRFGRSSRGWGNPATPGPGAYFGVDSLTPTGSGKVTTPLGTTPMGSGRDMEMLSLPFASATSRSFMPVASQRARTEFRWNVVRDDRQYWKRLPGSKFGKDRRFADKIIVDPRYA